MFSRRAGWELAVNPHAEALRARRERGEPVIDLTVSNPTVVRLGLVVADPAPVQALATAEGLRYAPHPKGLASARAAIASYYGDHGLVVDPEHVVLTASTSEAYSFLFKLLANPGDRVLVPRPGYPLFEYLASLEGIEALGYPNGSVRKARGGLEGGARAVLAVHPNNPSGEYLSPTTREALVALCAQHHAALIVDEVFFDYPVDARPPGVTSHALEHGALCFTLSGLSKVCGLPGYKLGWIVVSGPAEQRDEALARLEIIADTFLSVSTPVQHALGRLLDGRHGFQQRVRQRVADNLRSLERQVPVLPMQGGWTAIIPLPDGADDQAVALSLIEQGVVVHPGYLFELDRPALVVSLLVPPHDLERGGAALAPFCS